MNISDILITTNYYVTYLIFHSISFYNININSKNEIVK